MAEDNNSKIPSSHSIPQLNDVINKGLAKKVQKNIDDIYRNTYFSNGDENKYITSIRRQMDNDINSLMDKTKNSNGGANITDLYARTLAKGEDLDMKQIRHVLEDDSMLSDIMDLYSQNVLVKDMDREIDTVCKYMPKLEEALDIKKDNVLSADHFNDDATHINLISSSTSAASDTSTSNKSSNFESKTDIQSFIDKYQLDKLKEKLYKKTARYGEQFVYIISYNKALNRLSELKNGQILTEDTLPDAVDSICESIDISYNAKSPTKEFPNEDYGKVIFNESSRFGSIMKSTDDKFSNISVEFNKSGVIPSLMKDYLLAKKVVNETVDPLLEKGELGANRDTYISNRIFEKNMDEKFKKAARGGTLQAPLSLTTDGLKDPDREKNKKNNKESINIPGCIVQLLDHDMVKPLYINNICLGYYYIESDTPMDYEQQMTFTSTLGGLRPRRTARENENMNIEQNDQPVLMKIAKQISQKIDKKFINANQDLAQEIYVILKYNADHSGGKVSKIRISFIPPSDIVHSYFEFDEKKKRGVSDLKRSLFVAKLYSCLYISNTIALLTRGYDKRMYHVKQSVDTNITAVLLNVINQIKRSNFNLRQIENMNNILNVTGRFNDLVIPQNANGESPVQFEVMPGQNIEIKTEFMNMLEEMAVNQTGVSLEMVNSRYQEQTATHLTMTNSRFLIKVYARQKQYEEILSNIYSKIYQYEYGNDDRLKVELPPPIMLNFQNTSQILATAMELIQNIQQMMMPTEADETVKASFMGKLMKYYFKTFLPMDDIEKLCDEAKMDTKTVLPPDPNAMGGGQPGGMGM